MRKLDFYSWVLIVFWLLRKIYEGYTKDIRKIILFTYKFLYSLNQKKHKKHC